MLGLDSPCIDLPLPCPERAPGPAPAQGPHPTALGTLTAAEGPGS